MSVMVESQQSVGTKMMLPLASTPPVRGRDRRGYQLQPTAMHVNHGMLPAAALSNFFKAPSTPIRSKLPSISISDGSPVYRNKSIHQRNKCLAEVIQSQLVELKRLQDKYRHQKCESRALRLNRHKESAADESIVDLNKSNNAINDANKRGNNISRLLIPEVQLIPKQQPIKPTTLPVNKQSVSKTSPVQSDSRKKISLQTQSPTCQAAAVSPTAKPVTAPTDTIRTICKDNLLSLQISGRSSQTVNKTQASSHNNSSMDPIKMESISNWIQSVELAQRLEGKCSEVLSIPAL